MTKNRKEVRKKDFSDTIGFIGWKEFFIDSSDKTGLEFKTRSAKDLKSHDTLMIRLV